MRILCTEATRVKEESGVVSEYDAHHEYYVDDARGADLVAAGRAYELDAHGRRVEPKPAKSEPKAAPAKKTAARKAPAKTATGPAGKPGGGRTTKAVEAAPENKGGPEPAQVEDPDPVVGSPAETGD